MNTWKGIARVGLWALGAVASMVPAAAHAQGTLGANYNEHVEDVNLRELDSASAHWVRLFLPMPQVDRGAAEHGAGAPHGGHGTAFEDKQGRYRYTMFGNDPTAPWRMKFGLVPIDIGDRASIGIPRIASREPRKP
jgi:hypothetical protein